MLKYYFVKDAKMALFSALLKRIAIARAAPSLPWPATASWTRDERTKPVFKLDGAEPLVFNVSHQAGLVVLFAVCYNDRDGERASIGVDIVCPSERRDRDVSLIRSEGWHSFVDIHASVFGRQEVVRLKERLDTMEMRVDDFYALWCLREAYVKMTGDALLAEWLGDLEMRSFKAPPLDELEIWFKEEKLTDVEIDLQWCMDDYMIATAYRGDLHPVKYETLKLEDVLAEAEGRGA